MPSLPALPDGHRRLDPASSAGPTPALADAQAPGKESTDGLLGDDRAEVSDRGPGPLRTRLSCLQICLGIDLHLSENHRTLQGLVIERVLGDGVLELRLGVYFFRRQTENGTSPLARGGTR